jgi:hypothetical protein
MLSGFWVNGIAGGVWCVWMFLGLVHKPIFSIPYFAAICLRESTVLYSPAAWAWISMIIRTLRFTHLSFVIGLCCGRIFLHFPAWGIKLQALGYKKCCRCGHIRRGALTKPAQCFNESEQRYLGIYQPFGNLTNLSHAIGPDSAPNYFQTGK